MYRESGNEKLVGKHLNSQFAAFGNYVGDNSGYNHHTSHFGIANKQIEIEKSFT